MQSLEGQYNVAAFYPQGLEQDHWRVADGGRSGPYLHSRNPLRKTDEGGPAWNREDT